MSEELKPCPFCGREAERIDIDEGENAGGSCICCTVCQASGNVEFGRKENFIANWNRRAQPAPDALTGASEPSIQQIERAIEAYLEGVYLTDEQVYASVTAIVRAALSPDKKEGEI